MQLVAGAGIAAAIHPIGTRVRIRQTGLYGTVKSWGGAAPFPHVVALDCGLRVVARGADLERALPHRQWFLEALVFETRP